MTSAGEPTERGRLIDSAPWRRPHTRVLVGLGVGWALVAFEVQILSSVITPLGRDFGLLDADGSVAPGPLSVVWVLWFAGLLVGATVFGWLADRVGRRRLFVATLVLYATATVATALAPSFGVFLVFRFLTALGVGGEYAAVTAAITELAPARRRGAAIALTLNFWALGGVVAGLVGLVALSDLVAGALTVAGVTLAGWRVALLTGVLGAVYALVARSGVPESPRWLAGRGRVAEADDVLARLGLPRGAGGAATVGPVAPLRVQVARVWRAGRARVLYGMLLDFSGSGAYYGLFTFVGAYVLTAERIGVDTATVPVFTLVANLGALAGGVAVAVALDRAGRASTVVGAFGAAALASLLLALAALTSSAGLTLAAFTLAAFTATCCWISAYATFAELFATDVRATGIGLCVGAGRLGGMLGVVGLSFATGVLGLFTAFVLLAAFFGIGAVAGVLWRRHGVEGRRVGLDDVAARSRESAPTDRRSSLRSGEA